MWDRSQLMDLRVMPPVISVLLQSSRRLLDRVLIFSGS
jgi:hypothetical protein